MAGLNLRSLAVILLFCCCYNFHNADAYFCKANNRIGKCSFSEDCAQSMDKFNADCANSGLRGDVVCCFRPTYRSLRTTRRTTTSTTPATILEQEAINPRGLALLNQHNCGNMDNTRVAHGIDAALGEFPWIALLLNSENDTMCGGSVITELFVLTAAHCISSDLQFVRLGEHDLMTDEDCLANGYCQTFVQFRIDPMQKPFIHPDYNTVNKHKDVALIKLHKAIDFQVNQYIKPICLPTSPSDYAMLPTDNLVLAGWGLTESNDVRGSDVLQKGYLKLEALDICQNLHSLYDIDQSKLCVKSDTNQTVSCQGDSGSPIFWKTKYMKGRFKRIHYTQVGLVSLGGKVCGKLSSIPYAYENITDSMPWITNTILK
ncbi:PREDICTED: chymotrypsinogen A-like [Bactrocera latifrons]|uniref:Serine protease easter n=1 Tax=Bactrocera latifrons TaxID=174628 RepID=A0A0K8WKD3_BACLA|nr:PREDICTED: chymotrypsinogen A-like [Bactrocera latifrons]XP_018792564.1 PREDICTED: chymotrypsinogen A-like [Bactrocera latifrons]